VRCSAVVASSSSTHARTRPLTETGAVAAITGSAAPGDRKDGCVDAAGRRARTPRASRPSAADPKAPCGSATLPKACHPRCASSAPACSRATRHPSSWVFPSRRYGLASTPATRPHFRSLTPKEGSIGNAACLAKARAATACRRCQSARTHAWPRHVSTPSPAAKARAWWSGRWPRHVRTRGMRTGEGSGQRSIVGSAQPAGVGDGRSGRSSGRRPGRRRLACPSADVLKPPVVSDGLGRGSMSAHGAARAR
jgi:hypothetical protein